MEKLSFRFWSILLKNNNTVASNSSVTSNQPFLYIAPRLIFDKSNYFIISLILFNGSFSLPPGYFLNSLEWHTNIAMTLRPPSLVLTLSVTPSAVVRLSKICIWAVAGICNSPEVFPPPLIKYVHILNTKVCSGVAPSRRFLWLSQFELNTLLFPVGIYLSVLQVFTQLSLHWTLSLFRQNCSLSPSFQQLR